jgi:predicted dehydrogenase
MYKRILITGALALGFGAIGTATAHAHEGPGAVVEQFHDEFQVVDEFLTDICGFEVLVDGDIRGTFRLAPNGGIHVTEQGTVVLSNPATGKTLTNWWRQNYRGHGSETFDDGILTITFDDTITGIPERWLDDDGNTLIMDRGFARFVGEVVIDLADPEDPFDDEVIHFHEEIITGGPHPILERRLDPQDACDLLS